jgi:2-polyprenyl-3-methyl-5-hydroxy-6-metoxy-1,4-benzoquinol methylase
MNISPETQLAIQNVEYYKDTPYKHLDVAATLHYFNRKFVNHAPKDSLTPNSTVADVGCGFGWLAMAFALRGVRKIIAIDPDPQRLAAAKEIASLLGISDQIDWRVGFLGDAPMSKKEADLVYCIEVLEHVNRDESSLHDLDRITGRHLVLTTPNGAFPIVAHDTGLPFCHWLPMPVRDVYARVAGRSQRQEGNLFWTPRDFSIHLPDFRRISRFQHFPDVKDYFSLFPYYMPYGSGKWKNKPSPMSKIYFQFAACFGKKSHLFLHTLAGTFERIS